MALFCQLLCASYHSEVHWMYVCSCYRTCLHIRSHPAVMMRAYAHSRATVLFDVAYLSIELYFLMNLVDLLLCYCG